MVKMKGVGALLGDDVKASMSAWAKAWIKELLLKRGLVQQGKNEVKK